MSYSFTLITSSDSIGDALSAINNNYLYLDEWANSIQLSANNLWSPFVEYYKNTSLELKTNISKAQASLDKWKSMSTTVETNSANWIEPLIIYYPHVLTISQQQNSSYITTITQWVNSNFSVLSDNCTNGVCYLQTQECIIHVIRRTNSSFETPISGKTRKDRESEPATVSDSTLCQTADTIASGPCVVRYFGGTVGCDNGDFNCGGAISCTVSQQVTCNFDQTGVKTYRPYIKANLYYNYIDEYETTDLLRLKFIISDCSWKFDKQI